MIYDQIMVRFGELGTKGKNKKDFIRLLGKNIEHALKDFPNCEIEVKFDHIYVKLNGCDAKIILNILKDISGIHSLSLVKLIDKDIDNLKEVTLKAIANCKGQTFKVNSKRADKSFPIISDQINRIIAGEILRNTNLKVDVHNPDILVGIEVRFEGIYLFTETYKGSGGYPLGIGGKTMHMLSGGIDSPVAAYLMMKRGVKIECIHFASPPYTNIGVIEKLKDLLSKLNKYQPSIRLTIIPFTKLQEEIYKNCDESYAITIMRRMMYRLATALAKQRNCLSISNGESVGQVASQTLDSIQVINEVTNFPIMRPLVCYDKEDIIDLSKKIDCYEISIRPFEDCCTIFAPKNPKTKPSLEKCIEYETKFDYKNLVKEALENSETIFVTDEDKLF